MRGLELIIWGRFSENWVGKNVQKIIIFTYFWMLIVFRVFVLNHCFLSLEIDFKDFLKSFWAFFYHWWYYPHMPRDSKNPIYMQQD